MFTIQLAMNFKYNDLFKRLRFCTSILYADDTTLLVTGNSVRFLKCKMQVDLDSVSVWFRSNMLKLNVAKTKCMFFCKEGLNPNIELTVEGQVIDMVKKFKFLGVTFDCELTFEHHYLELYDKLVKSVFIIRTLSRMLPRSCLQDLYFAYFQSHLMYGILVWYPLLSKSRQKSLFLLQKKVIQIVCGVKYLEHCMPLFKKQQIVTLDDVLLLENCKLMFRISNDQCAKPLSQFFVTNGNKSSRYMTRNANVKIRRHTSSLVNRSFLCKSVCDWTKLKPEQKIQTNLILFRTL